MKEISTDLLKQGYIILPKSMLKPLLECGNWKEGDLEAWLRILMHVNYSEMSCCIGGVEITCKRGEAIHSYRRWMQIFCWKKYRTIYFFRRLVKAGIIEFIVHTEKITHIRVVNYDLWTGRDPVASEEAMKHKAEEFRRFWDRYHETVQRPKENVARARRVWFKLTAGEQRLAIERIEEFYYHQRDIRFIPQAATYLSDKAFLNEYD